MNVKCEELKANKTGATTKGNKNSQGPGAAGAGAAAASGLRQRPRMEQTWWRPPSQVHAASVGEETLGSPWWPPSLLSPCRLDLVSRKPPEGAPVRFTEAQMPSVSGMPLSSRKPFLGRQQHPLGGCLSWCPDSKSRRESNQVLEAEEAPASHGGLLGGPALESHSKTKKSGLGAARQRLKKWGFASVAFCIERQYNMKDVPASPVHLLPELPAVCICTSLIGELSYKED